MLIWEDFGCFENLFLDYGLLVGVMRAKIVLHVVIKVVVKVFLGGLEVASEEMVVLVRWSPTV